MTFRFRDADGHDLETQPETDLDGQPVVTLWTRGHYARVPVRIPVDRIEELVAGLRDTARQAAGAEADHRHTAALHYLGATNIPEQHA